MKKALLAFALILSGCIAFHAPLQAADPRSTIQNNLENAQDQLARVNQELAMHTRNAQGTLAHVDSGVLTMEEIGDEFSALMQRIQSLQQQQQELEDYIAELEEQLKETMEVG